MTRRRAAVAVVAALVLALLTAVPAHAVNGRTTGDWRERMLAQVNAARAAAGVDPVTACPALARSAGHYARAMARSGRFGHWAVDGTGPEVRIPADGYRGSVMGENLAGGQDTVIRAMRAWRGSPRHLALMTDPRVRHVGFGHAERDGSPLGEYWVQHYGAGGRCD